LLRTVARRSFGANRVVMEEVPKAFYEFFANTYGDRWDVLLKSMGDAKQVRRCCFHPYCQPEITWLPGCHWGEDEQGALPHYQMDPASVLVARALGVKPNDKVLDMCAAPGGKSLVLLESLAEGGKLIANDISRARRFRLKNVFDAHVPLAIRDCVELGGKDGLRFGMQSPDSFDRVLLDAPCSSEKHLLEQPARMEEWSEARSKRLGKRQYGLLTSAGLALKRGGLLMYATCSISHWENEDVVRRFLDRKTGYSVSTLDFPAQAKAEAKEFGYQFLPDISGFGPMYCCCLQKH
jgi:5-methylcytosine rRNA methyltransferase NSUN4